MADIVSDIYKKNPDVIAFSCYIWNWKIIQEIFEELHQILPEVPIWLGGPEVSFDSKDILEKYPYLTGIMIGEGEETFKNLAAYYIEGTVLLENVDGIMTKEYNYKERKMLPLSMVPFLYDDLNIFKNRIIYYESMRGCPFRCSYCLSSIDKSVRKRDLDLVKKELQFFLDQSVSQVKFIDRTFNCDHTHAMTIWKYIHENDNGITNFHFEIAGTILNEEELTLLNKMRPGLIQLEIGVQSTNPRTIEEINRVMDVSKLERIVAKIKKGKNIHQHLDLIAGLPYEDLESFKNSFNMVYKMRPDQLQLGFLKVLKGTVMAENKKEYGLVYKKSPPYEVLYTKWISYEEILQLKEVEQMLELFYNSNQFVYSLKKLEEVFEKPYQLYLEMAKYFEEKGYFVKSPARAYRYSIFYQFAAKKDPQNIKMYSELLTHDMYLRENLKSRPEFMKERFSQEEKDKVRLFYLREENEPKYLKKYKGYKARQIEKMTHIEKFMTLGQDTRYILYDYQERNPLNHEAKTYEFGEMLN